MKYFKLSEIAFVLASLAILVAVGMATEEKPKSVDPNDLPDFYFPR